MKHKGMDYDGDYDGSKMKGGGGVRHEDHKKSGTQEGYPSGVRGSSMGSTRTTKPNSGRRTTSKGRNHVGGSINNMNSGGNLGKNSY